MFDFDGTLTKFKYAENKLLPCKKDDFVKYVADGGEFYKNVSVLNTMKYIIEQIGKENVWVLTTSIPEIRKMKKEVIVKNFQIPEERIIHSDSDIHKIELLKEIYNKQKNDKLVFVEDTVYTLMNAEDCLDFVEGYHISSLIP